MNKICSMCQLDLPLESFYLLRKNEPTGRRSSRCKECDKAIRRTKIPYEINDDGIPLCKCHNSTMVKYKNVRWTPESNQKEYYWQCSLKRSELTKEYNKKTKLTGHKASSQTYEYQRNKRLQKYGITIEDYDQMFQEQDGVCAICGGPPDTRWKMLAVDHCHQSLEVRGLLCMVCNTMLGRLENNLFAVINYLGLELL